MITTICGSCEREWPSDDGLVCPKCGNDGDIEGHAFREDEPAVRRRLTRQERLEAFADAGTDTWEEYRGER